MKTTASGSMALALLVVAAWSLPAAADESDGERLLRRVLDARERDGEVHFRVQPDAMWDEYRCWYSGEWLRYEARRSPNKIPSPGAPGAPPMPTETVTIVDYSRNRDELSIEPGAIVQRRGQMLPFSFHPHLFGLGWPGMWLPTRAAECLFSGRYPDGRVVGVSHRMTGTAKRDGRRLALVESTWERVDGQPRVRIRRWIDEARGPSIVAAEVLYDDSVQGRVDSRLADWGGVWFPERVVWYVRTAAGEERIEREISVSLAKFEPVDRALFTTQSLGLEPGTNILTSNGRKNVTTVWTGREAVSPAEFKRLEDAGLVKAGPRVLKFREKLAKRSGVTLQRPLGPPPPTLPSGRLDLKRAGDAFPGNWLYDALLPPDLWDRYVDHVAIAREFDVNRKRAAQGILKELRGRAEAYRASRAADYKKAEALPDAKARDAELDRLEQGVDELFKELKERVGRL